MGRYFLDRLDEDDKVDHGDEFEFDDDSDQIVNEDEDGEGDEDAPTTSSNNGAVSAVMSFIYNPHHSNHNGEDLHSEEDDSSSDSQSRHRNHRQENRLIEMEPPMTHPQNQSHHDIVSSSEQGSYIQHQQQSQHHYHIYMPPPQASSSSPGCCRRIIFSWWTLSTVLLIAHVIARYGPPAPPPPSHNNNAETEPISWNFFLKEQFQIASKLIKTWGHELPSHVSYWCWQAIRDDMMSTKLSFGSNVNHNNLEDPCEMNLSQISLNLKEHVMGQDYAVDQLSSALTNWNDQLQNSLDEIGNHHDHKIPGPLFLYFTGGTSVGKRFLAQTMAHALFDQCDLEDPFLEMSGSEVSSLSSLEDELLSGITRSGSVVYVSKVEQMEPDLLQSLIRSAKQSNCCTNTIFILSSNVGSKTIHKSIRRYGGMDRLPIAEVQALVAYEVGSFHRSIYSNEDETTDISKFIEAVIPLSPLDKASIQGILKRNIPYQMTGDVLSSLIDRLEFQTWKHKATDTELFTFSPTGATPAVELAKRLQSKMTHSCPTIFHDDSDLGTFFLGKDNGLFILERCRPRADRDGEEESIDCTEVCRFPF